MNNEKKRRPLKLKTRKSSSSPIINEKISSYFPILSQESDLKTIGEDTQNKYDDILIEKPVTNSDKKLILNTSDESVFSTKEKFKSQSNLFQIDKVTKTSKRKVKKICSDGDVESLTKSSSGGFDLNHVQLALALSNSLQDEISNQKTDGKAVLSSQEKLQNLKETLQQFGFNTGNMSSGLTLSKGPAQKRKKKQTFRTTLLIRSENDRKRIIQQKVSEILSNIASYNEYKDKNSPPIEILEEKPHSFSLREIYGENAPIYKKSYLTFENKDYFNSLVNYKDCAKIGSLLKDWHKIPGREKTPLREIEKNSSEETKNQYLQECSPKSNENETSPKHNLQNSPKSIINICQISKNPNESKSNKESLRSESPDLFSDDSCDYVVQKDQENLSPDIFLYENYNDEEHFSLNSSTSSIKSPHKLKNVTKNSDIVDLTQTSSNDSLSQIINIKSNENTNNDTVIKEIISKAITTSQHFELSHENLDLIYDLALSPQKSPGSPQKTTILHKNHEEIGTRDESSDSEAKSVIKNSNLDPEQVIFSQKQVLTCYSSDSEADSFLNSSDNQLEIEQNYSVCKEQNITLLNVSGRTNCLVNEHKTEMDSNLENPERSNNDSVNKLEKKCAKKRYKSGLIKYSLNSSNSSLENELVCSKSVSKGSRSKRISKNHNQISASSSSEAENCSISPKKGSDSSAEAKSKNYDRISVSSGSETEENPTSLNKSSNFGNPNLKIGVSKLILSPGALNPSKQSLNPELEHDMRSENQTVFDIKRLNNVKSALDLTSTSFLQNLDDFSSFNLSISTHEVALEEATDSEKPQNTSPTKNLSCSFNANKIGSGRKRSISLISSDSEVENNCDLLSQGASDCLVNDQELNYSCYRSYLKLYRSGSMESASSESSDDNISDVNFCGEDDLQQNFSENIDNNMKDVNNQKKNITSKSPNSTFRYINENNDLDHFADQLSQENVYNNQELTSKYQDFTSKTLIHRRISELKGMVSTPISKTQNVENTSICEEENILDKTPDNKNASPGPELIIKTSNVTPMANYSEMDTPQRKKELDKYGLKPMSKGKSVKILEYLYNATHPICDNENDVQTRLKDSSSEDENENEPASKRKKVGKKEKYVSNRAVRKRKSQQLFIHKDTKESITLNFALDNLPEDEMIFEKVFSKKIASCAVPFHIAWHNFITTQPGLKEAILLYEPIQLEEIYLYFKNLGFKYHIQDIQTFLDKKCITIRTAQNNR